MLIHIKFKFFCKKHLKKKPIPHSRHWYHSNLSSDSGRAAIGLSNSFQHHLNPESLDETIRQFLYLRKDRDPSTARSRGVWYMRKKLSHPLKTAGSTATGSPPREQAGMSREVGDRLRDSK